MKLPPDTTRERVEDIIAELRVLCSSSPTKRFRTNILAIPADIELSTIPLKPGDMLNVRVYDNYTQEYINVLEEAIKGLGLQNAVIITCKGIDMRVEPATEK